MLVGYSARAVNAAETPDWSQIPFIIQTLLPLLAPALYAASIYMLLGRIIGSLRAEHLSFIPVRWLTKIFVFGDVLSFAFQCIGGGILSGADDKSGVDRGQDMILVGLGVQILFFACFMASISVFHYRIVRQPTTLSLAGGRPWKEYILVLYFTSFLILVRSIFRVAEFAEGQSGAFNGLFYPRHRLLVWAYEQEIRTCGFRGAQPYWDWSLDSGSAEDFFNSPVFDTKTGFGGNGEFLPFNTSGLSPLLPITNGKVPSAIADRRGGGCVHDGPFANMTIHMGPGPSTAYKAQCVRRDFVPSKFIASASVEAVSTGMDYADFGSFTRQTELTVHGAGHVGVGGLYGVLTDAWASPGDPLFYLHHANMDRLWWSWQSKNLSTRLTEISGPIVANDWLNEKGRNVTLDDIVFVGTTVNVTMPIRDVMDIRKSLGYVYDKLY
ncbi:Tyrosinase-like protein orsC [Colletotrichum sp. SAR 10_86]|nr:Tyrosinase-like protein orsC [Colletotrichum sp. SAR 10_86]